MPRNSNSAVFAKCDPSIPPADGHCFLFKLPLELRDIIYKYALAANHGLIAQMDAPSEIWFYEATSTLAQPICEFNQLQYTNKQLRAETKGLMLELNDLTFPTTTAQRGTDVAITFLEQCCDTIKARLGNIHACYGDTVEYFAERAIFQNIRDAGPFSQHCSRYQKSRILVYLPVTKDTEIWGWIGFMNLIQRLIRGRSVFTGLPVSLEAGWEWLVQILSREWSAGVKNVPVNLRIVPSRRTGTAKELLAQLARHHTTGRNSVHGLVAAANKIFEEGL
ncbi:hypothetical protein FB567DRAFT_545916 [Paraphoma chrysanthemicola]|uniref:Uncharacterized protein n=1 Tax=Paraphoma chrysanthemicola TaxID=798071 RepID=A0A8K0W1E5_9PLEO|nr:hypothetical protein FB567DRAFT_545916 [Paraphoma chrysanthemicola]